MWLMIDIPKDSYDFIQECDSINSAVTEDLYQAVYEGVTLSDLHSIQTLKTYICNFEDTDSVKAKYIKQITGDKRFK